MLLVKTEIIIALQLVLYHALWVLLAYFVRLKNITAQNIAAQKNRVLYWVSLLIIILQVFLAQIGFPDAFYFDFNSNFYFKIIVLSLLGIFIDSVFTSLGYFTFLPPILSKKSGSKKIKFIPFWLCLLWISFAIAMQYVLFFTSNDWSNLFFWGLLAAFGFPFSYFCADRLKVLKVEAPWRAYFYQGLFWFFALPLLQLF